MIVLDASAVLALLFREEGHERVSAVIDDACMSTVNLAEVLGRFARDGQDVDAVAARILAQPVEIVPFSAAHSAVAARLLPSTQPLGLSLGDRACLALAIERSLPTMTADRAWSRLDLGVDIHIIRP